MIWIDDIILFFCTKLSMNYPGCQDYSLKSRNQILGSAYRVQFRAGIKNMNPAKNAKYNVEL